MLGWNDLATVLVSPVEAYYRHRDEILTMLDERFWPREWLEAQIASGGIGLLANDGAVIGFEVRTYPGGATELHGMFAAGDLPAILELIEQICARAAAQGLTIAAIESRSGWEKALKTRGFVRDKVRIVKELG